MNNADGPAPVLADETRATRSDGRNFPAQWPTPEQNERYRARARELRATGLTIRQVQAALAREGLRRSFGWVHSACSEQ